MVYLASTYMWLLCCNVNCLHNIIQSKNRHARGCTSEVIQPLYKYTSAGGLEACPPGHFSVLPVDVFLTQNTKSELQQNLCVLGCQIVNS